MREPGDWGMREKKNEPDGHAGSIYRTSSVYHFTAWAVRQVRKPLNFKTGNTRRTTRKKPKAIGARVSEN